MKSQSVTLIIVLLVSTSAFAANPADLTSFERFGASGFAKFVYGEDSKIAYVRLPAFKTDISLAFQAWENSEGTAKEYSGWLIKRFTPNLDAALIGTNYWVNGETFAKTFAAFDFHGKLFDRPTGIGFLLPFDKEDFAKVSPRITFGNITTFLTLSEEKNSYLLGASHSKDGMKVEVAYDNNEIWHLRVSKSIKINEMELFPEFRLKATEKENYFGFGIGFCF